MECASLPGHRGLWFQLDKASVFILFVACIFISNGKFDSLSHHAPLVARRSKDMYPWVQNMIGSMAMLTYAWKPHAMHCLFSVCCQTVFCRKILPTGRILCRPALYGVPTNPINCRWKLRSDGGNSVRPVVLCRTQGTCSSTLAFLFLEGQSSTNRGGRSTIRVFRARRIRACIIRASRGRGCGYPLLSFAIFSFKLN